MTGIKIIIRCPKCEIFIEKKAESLTYFDKVDRFFDGLKTRENHKIGYEGQCPKCFEVLYFTAEIS